MVKLAAAFSATRRSPMLGTALAAALIATVLMAVGCNANNAAPVVTVSKTRQWIPDTFRNFRRNNVSKETLPKYAELVTYPLIARHTAVHDEVNQRVVVYGGIVPDRESPRRISGAATSRVYQYDIPSNRWYAESLFTAAPPIRADHIAWMVGDVMWVHGGAGADDLALSDIWTYRNRTWRRKGHGPRLTGHSANWVDPSAVWVFGGRDATQFSNRLYNVLNGTFDEIFPSGTPPSPRAYHASAFINNTFKGESLFIMGGFDGHRAMNDLWYVNFEKRAWVLLSSDGKSDPRTSYDGVQILSVQIPGMMRHVCGGDFPRILCIGGEGNDLASIVEYDMFAERWIPTFNSNPEMVPPLGAATGVTLFNDDTAERELWVIGGATNAPKGFPFPKAILRTAMATERCPQGYMDADFDGRCLRCPFGSAMYFEKNPHLCELCPGGTFEKYGECRMCPRSTYQPKNGTTNATACLPCPAGHFTIDVGADSINDCISCPIGSYAVPFGCAKCPPGTYGTAAGQEAMDAGCAPCSYGSYSAEGALSCTTCPAGSSTGPFMDRIRPHRLVLRNMGEVLPGGGAPGCPTSTAITQVTAGAWFYITVQLADYGEDGTTNAIDPLRRDYNAPHPGATTVWVEYDGDPTYMFYNCRDHTIPSTVCNTVTRNESTPARTNTGQFTGCGANYISFGLRFDETSFLTTVRVRSEGLIGFDLPLKIVALGQQLNITGVPQTMLVGSLFQVSFTAVDLFQKFEQTATDTFSLSVSCSRGVSAPQFSLGGGAAANSQSVTFVDGRVSTTLEFTEEAQDCQWSTNRNGFSDTQLDLFATQQPSSLSISLGHSNVTSGGFINVFIALLNSTGDVVTGDSTSLIKVDFTPDRPYNAYLSIKNNPSGNVIDGVFRSVVQVESSYPDPSVLVSGTFTASVTGMASPPAPVESEKFYVASQRNGTYITLQQDKHPFPTEIAVNKTFKVELQLLDQYGNIDSTRSPLVWMQLVGCPDLRFSLANTSTPFVRLHEGHGVFPVIFRGKDSSNCRVLFHEYGLSPEGKQAKGAWSPVFSTLTPHHLRHDNDCQHSTGCACIFEVGKRYTISVGVMSESNVDVFSDSSTIVKMLVSGNASAVVEVDGRPERRVNGGYTNFEIEILQSDVPVSIVFFAGFWRQREVINVTHFATPFYRATFESLGDENVFYNNHIQSAWMCDFMPVIFTTKMVVLSRVPTWAPNDEPWELEIGATNDQNILNTSYNEPFTVEMLACYHGKASDISWQIIRQQEYTPTAMAGATAAGTFFSGKAKFQLIGKYLTQTYFDAGVIGCNLKIVSSDLTILFVDGFTVRKVFPSCTLCEPGYWSEGGTGVTTVTTHHPGGCVPCPAGTFGTGTGATNEDVCKACPTPYGFNGGAWGVHTLEALTDCTPVGTCQYGNGLAGSLSTGTCSNMQAVGTLPDEATYGRIGRRCANAFCAGAPSCPAGQWMLNCAGFGANQANCEATENRGLCTWDGAACGGASYECVICPAGRVSAGASTAVNNMAGRCQQCNPGGWSENEGHTSRDATNIQLEPFRCDGTFTWYNDLCTGAGTGQCPNGTASATLGATSSDTCVTCAKGTYAHQRVWYRRLTCGTSPCPELGFTNPFCNYGNCYQCPLSEYGILGARECLPCPAGTYNNETGRNDPFLHCIPCPAGTYCPAGTIEPLTTDTWNTRLDLSGTSQPEAVSFDENEDTITCTAASISEHPGYVRDGRFTDFVLRNYRATDDVRKSYMEAWHTDPDTYVPYTIVSGAGNDRGNLATSGAARCNATGCHFFQTIELNHMVRSDYIARLWVFNALEYQNVSAVMRPTLGNHRPYAGFKISMYSDVNLSIAEEIVVGRSIPVTAAPTNTWIALEADIYPPWPVAFVNFNITTHSYYQGYALYDDAQLRPSVQRICNCSTGFYFNESRPERPCMRCPPGFACSGGQLTRCENSWTVSAEPGCNRCRPGWQCDADGRGRSIPCAVYNKKDNDTETCSPCPLGYACQDGEVSPCSDGTYGDGGLACVTCEPGFYSPPGPPVRECLRCPAGTSTDHMRTGCTDCPANFYSADGLGCVECPIGSFSAAARSSECTSCTALFLQRFNYSVYRNSETRLAVIPALCAEHYDWAIESIHHISGQELGFVEASRSSKDAVYYRANALTGLHSFDVFSTPELNEPIQRSEVHVHVLNRNPIVQDDDLQIAHPTEAYTLDLTYVTFNDYDPDTDPLYFATAGFNGAYYDATNVAISADRRSLTVDMPVGFKGPAKIAYTVMDQYHATLSDCIPPVCRFSGTGQITITARDQPPVAVDDRFDVLNGEVYVLDVGANDTDPENDDFDIVSVSASAFGTQPGIGSACTIGTTCASGTCTGVSSCTCAVDASRNLCWPSALANRRTLINYAAPPTRCGTDSFSYTIQTNDGTATANVYARVRRCYCSVHPAGVNLIFAMDATVGHEEQKWQLSFIDAVQKRAAAGAAFEFALFGVGQSTRWHNLTTAHIDFEYIDANLDGENFPYAVGAAMRQMGDGTATSAMGTPGTRRTVMVLISGSASVDDVISPGGELASTFAAGEFHTAVISVQANGDHYLHSEDLTPIYRKAVRNFDTELQDPQIAYDLMDEICSLA